MKNSGFLFDFSFPVRIIGKTSHEACRRIFCMFYLYISTNANLKAPKSKHMPCLFRLTQKKSLTAGNLFIQLLNGIFWDFQNPLTQKKWTSWPLKQKVVVMLGWGVTNSWFPNTSGYDAQILILENGMQSAVFDAYCISIFKIKNWRILARGNLKTTFVLLPRSVITALSIPVPQKWFFLRWSCVEPWRARG